MSEQANKAKDELVQKLISVVLEQKQTIAEATKKPTWVTNCAFRYTEDTNGHNAERYYGESRNEGFNINTVSNTLVLVHALAFLIKEETAFDEANKRLGIDETFKWRGYTVSEWEADFKAKATRINLSKTKASLEEDEARLNKLVSKEKREELELAALAAKYGI